MLLGLLVDTRAATRKITLNGLAIELDAGNGGMVSLSYPNVGRILSTESETASLLDLAFPLADYVPMRLGSRFSHAVFAQKQDAITVTWLELAPSRTHVKLPAGSASASVTFAAAPDGRSVILRCRIENKFTEPIPQILFPDFAGLRAIGAPEATKLTMSRGMVTPPSPNAGRAATVPRSGRSTRAGMSTKPPLTPTARM